MHPLKNLEKIPEDVRRVYEPYLQELLEILKEDIICVCIYGPAAGSNYQSKKTPIQSVIIFNDFDFSHMKKSLKIIQKGLKKKIVAPLFITKPYLEGSLDVFPVEFFDMKEDHVCIYGEDALSDIEVQDQHLRLFCEQQIKGKLIRIRQAYLEIGLSKTGIEALLKESFAALLGIFRNCIRLKGRQPPVDQEEIVRQLCGEFQLNEDVFIPILKDTANDEKIAGQDVQIFLEKYIEQLKSLAIAVDQL